MSIAEIIEIEKARFHREKQLYDVVYDRLKNKINNAVRARATECVYTIPEYIPGYTLINIPKTMIYLIEKLNVEKFITIQLTNKDIYITWDLMKLEHVEKINDSQPHSQPYSHKQPIISAIRRKDIERQNEDFINSLVVSKKKDIIKF